MSRSVNAAAGPEQTGGTYVLRLFVSGMNQRSLRALSNLHRICEAHLREGYELEVVDIYQNPEQAVSEQIIAAPTLVRITPLPQRRMVGDLSEEERVMASLGLQAA